MVIPRYLWPWRRPKEGRAVKPAGRPGRRLAAPPCLEELEGRTLLAGNTLATASLLSLNAGLVAGVLGSAPDFYAVRVPEAGRLTATAQPDGTPVSGFHARLSLLDAAGHVLVQSDGQSPTNPDDLIDLHVTGSPPGTTYYLEVQALGTTPCAYTMTASLAPSVPPFQAIPAGSLIWGLATADFNGDGVPDLATASFTGTVSVTLGRGDGTFSRARDYAVGAEANWVIAADLNGDGKIDLASANYGDGTVSVLFGRGDGTFDPQIKIPIGDTAAPGALVAGDFNHDGVTDLAVTDNANGQVSVLLGLGHGRFADPVSYAVGAGPYGIIAAHFAGSPNLDLAVANYNDNTVSLLAGNGDGTFQAQRTYAVGEQPYLLASVDFNGDGKIDLATANFESNDASVLLNAGGGRFGPARSLPAGAGPEGIVAADFNGDGKIDLATANFNDGTVSVFLGHGDGTFGSQLSLPGGSDPTALVAADLNADGHIDLAVGNDSRGGIVIELGRGNGTFQAPEYSTPGAEPQGIVRGDFNGDGVPDLATIDYATNDVQVLLGREDGTFQTGGRFTLGSDPIGMTIGDFNGDGIPDLVSINFSTGNVSVLLGRGDGTFGSPSFFDAGATPYSVVVGDFNGDGIPDLATANQGSNDVSVLLGNGDGTFQAPINTPVGPQPASLAVGDFNGDGVPDLAVADAGSNDVFVLLGRGDGRFTPGVRLPAGTQPNSVVVADFNGDKKLDLAIANMGSGNVSIFLGHGDGTFSVSPAPYQTGDSPIQVSAADLNGDGSTDLVVVNQDDNNVTLLLGNGDGTFRDGGDVAVGTMPQALVAADLNGDGRLDLATVNLVSSDVTVLLGNGDGTFRSPLSAAVPTGPVAAARADFNGDGNLDLVTANPSAGTVSVRLGRGDGTFQAPVTYTVGNGPRAVVTGDFNGDGRPDLAVANFLDGTVSVLLGLGDGTFQAQHTYQVGNGPDAIVTGDFNGDGTPDLAVANYGSGTVTILPGRRDGTFGASITIRVGDGPDALAAADVDGDGLDLVVGDYLSHDVTILMDDGRGHFSARTSATLPAGPASVVTGDFNGDGVVDVAAACPAVGIFLLAGQELLTAGPGGYALQAPQLIATAAEPVALVAADFNGDGRLDLAYADDNARVVRVLLALGNGTFQAQAAYDVGPYPMALVAGDFSNSGRADLVTANGLGAPVSVAVGLGDGTFTNVAVASAPVPSAPVVADLNGDGVPDVIVLRQDGKILFPAGLAGQPGMFGPPVVLNPDPAWAARDMIVGRVGRTNMVLTVSARTNTDVVYAYAGGRFVRAYVGPIQAALPSLLLGGDVNGDGLTDLIIASAATGQVFVALQRPVEHFGHHMWDYQFQLNPGISGVTLADLNGDGLPDIVVTNQATGEIDVLLNSTTDPFSTRLVFRSGTGLYGLTAGDDPVPLQSGDLPVAAVAGLFGGGTIPELAVLNRGVNRVDLLVADGQGGLYSPSPAAELLTGCDPVAIVSGDFNGDGRPDLAVLNCGDDDISVFLGDGRGGFTRGAEIPAGNQAAGLAVADANGDGIPDLLVSNAQGDVLTLLGNGDGTFQPYQRLDGHVALAAADVDDDGRQEFVLADAGRDRVSLLSGQAGGQFVQGRQDGVQKPNAVKLADLNGDGLLDLIVANGGGNDVLVYPGLGDGRFGAAMTFRVGTDPAGVTVADLNGDGVPDLVVANEGSNDVSVLFGHGRGAGWTLVAGPRLQAGLGPVATVVADATGNGVPDLLVANSQANTVTLLPGVGGGFFDDRHPVIFDTGIDPEALFVGNFDGQLGLVTVNAGSNDLTFFPGFGAGRSIPSGGTNPAAAVMGDFRHDGFDDLLVANGDGRFVLFTGGTDGLQSVATALRRDLANASDMALASLGRTGLSLYVAVEGQESVAGLTFALDVSPTLPSNGTADTSSSALPVAAEFSAVSDTSLGTVATLVVGAADAPPPEDAVASVAAPLVSDAPPGGTNSTPGGVIAAPLDPTGPGGPDSPAGVPGGATREAGLAAFLLGFDETPSERWLGGQTPAAAQPGPGPALWDWLDAGAPSAPLSPPAPEEGSAGRPDGGAPAGGGEGITPPVSPPTDPAAAFGEEQDGPAHPGSGPARDLAPLGLAPGADRSDEGAVPERPGLSAVALYAGLVVTAVGTDERRNRRSGRPSASP
jgi:hypothetical protein